MNTGNFLSDESGKTSPADVSNLKSTQKNKLDQVDTSDVNEIGFLEIDTLH